MNVTVRDLYDEAEKNGKLDDPIGVAFDTDILLEVKAVTADDIAGLVLYV